MCCFLLFLFMQKGLILSRFAQQNLVGLQKNENRNVKCNSVLVFCETEKRTAKKIYYSKN